MFSHTIGTDVGRNSLSECNENLLDLPALTTGTKGRAHGVDLNPWNVTVVRPSVAEKTHLGGIFSKELGDWT